MLTDTRVKTAKPQDKIFKLTDERGLHLSVYPNGSKLWQMRYRFEGKQKTASIGKYPEVSLAEARMQSMRATAVVGAPDQAAEKLRKLASSLELDELVVCAWTHDPAVQLRSFELLARAFDLPAMKS